MKIEQRRDGGKPAKETRAEAGDILSFDLDRVPVCSPDCPEARPGRCTRRCPDIPRALSSDPERHPVEARIAPLVFELKRLGVFDPCWSCEGHNDPQGKLWKIPRVWFYCASVVHVRVLADAVRQMYGERKLNAPWRVALTLSTKENPDTAFSLEPDVESLKIGLAALHVDVETLAEQLQHVVHLEARQLAKSVE